MIREIEGRICKTKYPTLERDAKKNMQRRDDLYGVQMWWSFAYRNPTTEMESIRGVDHEKTPNPFANHANDSIVIVAMAKLKPNACRSMADRAALHVAHS